MSGKNQKIAKAPLRLILFLLIVEIVLVAIGFLNQLVWQLNSSSYVHSGIGVIAIIILLVAIRLVAKVKNKMTTTSHNGGDLLDQASVIIESIGDGVVTVNEQSNISLINPEAKEISGWTDDAIDMNYQTVLHLVDATGQAVDESLNPITMAQKTSTAQTSRDFFLKTAGNKTVPVHIQVSPVANSGSLVVAFRNISLEIEKERQQLEFISTASHEMRTPVAAIDGYLGLIVNPKICTIDEKALDYATKARASSKHLGDLFKNLLDISKVEDGRLRANLEAVDAVEFVREVSQNLAPLADAKNLKITFLPDESKRKETKLRQSLFVQADKQMLTESLANLIENAIKYTKAGQIEVNVITNQQGEVVISVRDSGIGIPKEDLPHLFQKFYRVDNRDTREINGTGLGLYLTRKMIEHMRGRIWVESELEKGSQFFIALARLSQKQVKQLLDIQQVQPDNSPAITSQLDISAAPANEQSILGEPIPIEISSSPPEEMLTTPNSSAEQLPIDNSPIEASRSDVTPPDTSKVLSSESAERLRQLGYNTADFTVIGASPWENPTNTDN